MTTRDKWGLAILIGLFVALGVLLALTFRPASDSVRNFEDSIFVEQRMKNLQKPRQP